nr:hypothetical protein [Liquorilactobacillus satsumensis]
MQSIINKHKSFLNDILGAYADYPVNPKQLLKNYASQPNKEKYKLINCIYENEYYVRRRLKREATQMRTATL